MFVTNWTGKWKRRLFCRRSFVIIGEQFYATAWRLCYNVYDDFSFLVGSPFVRRSFTRKNLKLSSFSQAGSEVTRLRPFQSGDNLQNCEPQLSLCWSEKAFRLFGAANLGQQTLPKKPIPMAVCDQSINLGSKSSSRKFFNCKKRYNVWLDTTWSNPHRPQKLQKRFQRLESHYRRIRCVTPSSPDFNYLNFTTFFN